ncbi:MAG: restriction endonuclease subunit S [Gammaproteobacteria bacterium]|nr:restriction endonuclease subunit S [Gammaproteobacteria bacterium]
MADGQLADVADVEMGQSPPGAECNTDGHGTPLLNGPTEFGPHHPTPAQWTTDPRRMAHAGDILFCVRGSTTGRMNWADQDYAIGRGVAAIRHRKGGEFQHFVRGVIESRLPFLLASATGSTFPNVSRSQLLELACDIPSLSEQKAIAHILGTLDEKVDLNRRMTATLEAIARTIFKSWFVDFDPVHATIGGLDAAVPEAVQDLFPASLEDSELGKIPLGWRTGILGDMVGFQNGYAFRSKDWQDSGVPVVKIGSVKPGFVDLNQVSYVSDCIAQENSRYRLQVADLLVGMTGYVGEVGLVPPTDVLPLLNQRVGKFVLPTPGAPGIGFVYCLTRRAEFKQAVTDRAHGSAQPNVSSKEILAIPVVIPPSELVTAFNQLMAPVFEKVLSRLAESRSLATLRDTLLPALTSGDMNTPDELLRGDLS